MSILIPCIATHIALPLPQALGLSRRKLQDTGRLSQHHELRFPDTTSSGGNSRRKAVLWAGGPGTGGCGTAAAALVTRSSTGSVPTAPLGGWQGTNRGITNCPDTRKQPLANRPQIVDQPQILLRKGFAVISCRSDRPSPLRTHRCRTHRVPVIPNWSSAPTWIPDPPPRGAQHAHPLPTVPYLNPSPSPSPILQTPPPAWYTRTTLTGSLDTSWRSVH